MNEIVKNINLIKEWSYVTSSKLQSKLCLGFNKASKILLLLIDLGFVSEKKEKEGFKINSEKIKEILVDDGRTLEIRLEELLARRNWLKEQLNK